MTKGKEFREEYYSGISGLQLPVPKYKFPIEHQSASRLAYYSSLFNSIEINSSFYKIPLARTVRKWSDEVSGNFKFTFKLWREITHVKDLRFNTADVVQFINVINQAGNGKGTLLIQFPPGLKSNRADQLIRLLDSIKEADPSGLWPIALEFRNRSWYEAPIHELIGSYHASLVIHDKKGSSTPSISSPVKVVYLRFHGPTGDYRGSYSNDFLLEYAVYIQAWLEEGKTVYVYFNNTLGGAIDNLNYLNRLVIESQTG